MQLQISINDKEPLYIQIYNDIKNKIQYGHFSPNTKLPSARLLATNLNVSRNTIDLAYSQLISEGYIYSKARSGYYVSTLTDLPNVSLPVQKSTPVTFKENTASYLDFSPFAIDTNHFPYHTWKRLLKESMNVNSNDLFLLGENQGDEALRIAIHRYLTNFRFVNCTPNQIIIGAGSDYLLQLLCQIIQVQQKSEVPVIGMENPTYMRAYHIFRGYSYSIVPVSMDKNGIHIDALNNNSCNLAYVTPSHQYPTGRVMPIARRLDLLNWSKQNKDRYIIEDDHDSEFRYKGKPIPSLQGIDTSSKVIYIGTFSRALTPALRIAYMVLPESLYQIYHQNFYYYSSTVSRIDQSLLTEFLQGGYFERHLNKMRKLYKNKHDILINSLKLFGEHIIIQGENAGLHLVVTFLVPMKESELIKLAEDEGIKLYGIQNHYIKSDDMTLEQDSPTILIGYGNLKEEEIINGIELLYEKLKNYLNN